MNFDCILSTVLFCLVLIFLNQWKYPISNAYQFACSKSVITLFSVVSFVSFYPVAILLFSGFFIFISFYMTFSNRCSETVQKIKEQLKPEYGPERIKCIISEALHFVSLCRSASLHFILIQCIT